MKKHMNKSRPSLNCKADTVTMLVESTCVLYSFYHKKMMLLYPSQLCRYLWVSALWTTSPLVGRRSSSLVQISLPGGWRLSFGASGISDMLKRKAI